MDVWKTFWERSWLWAWKAFARYSQLDLDPHKLTTKERWSVIGAASPELIRTRFLRPARLWLLTQIPAWVVASRLRKRSHGWYRIPSPAAVEQVRLRFDVWPIEVGDHVRIKSGRLTAIGYATPTFTEIIFVLPNGELEPDPSSSEMTRALAAYNAACR